jgi:ABC-type uncharacterized transport system permease subunit
MGINMKNKNLPLIIMLFAGAITSIIAYLKKYSTQEMLFTVLIVLVVFYLIGMVVKEIVEYFLKTDQADTTDSEKVIEKESETTENAQGESKIT